MHSERGSTVLDEANGVAAAVSSSDYGEIDRGKVVQIAGSKWKKDYDVKKLQNAAHAEKSRQSKPITAELIRGIGLKTFAISTLYPRMSLHYGVTLQ